MVVPNVIVNERTTKVLVDGKNVNITFVEVPKTVTVEGGRGARGFKGEQGDQGDQGLQGVKGDKGDKGDQGDVGEGVPVGGTTGQALVKIDGTNYNTEWSTINSAEWGSITGTLSSQTDLQTALNNKYDTSNPDGFISSYTVTEADVTQHEAALSITESQISDLTHTTPAGADTEVQYNNSGSFGASDAFRWDNTAGFPKLLLGEGTFTPEASLHIDQPIGAGQANFLLFRVSTGGTPRFSIRRNGVLDITSSVTIPGGSAFQFGGSNTRISGAASGHIAFHTVNGTERMRVATDGKVGIGTSTPAADVDVYSSSTGGKDFLKFEGPGTLFRFLEGASSMGAPGIISKGLTASHPTFLIGDTHTGGDTGTQPLFRISGRRNNGTVNTRPLFDVANVNSPKFTVHNNGNCGIMTATPSQKLHVVGNAYVTGNVFTDNNFGAGTSSPTERLHVTGNVYIEGGKLIMDSATKQWEITIDDDGNLTTTEVV